VPVICCLRQSDKPFRNSDYNCRVDNPPEWVRLLTNLWLELSKSACTTVEYRMDEFLTRYVRLQLAGFPAPTVE
jgi:hypothetical protein